MKITQDVELPDGLLAAARAGELVLFVGAGASMSGPSDLPDFNELARLVAARLGREYLGKEPADAFLGRLSNEFPLTKEVAREMIAKPSSAPNATHRSIARLAAATKAAVVTTNYDQHITSAAVAEDLELGDVFNAPAVPLARTFGGLVHLHGAVSRPADELVLTDEDFGRAYLTDGWARRFVQELFTHRTVLFIGYSHNDVVVTYLARGLPPNTRRYVLTDDPENSRWDDLRIEAIGYSPAEGHKALPEALDAWATLLRMGNLDHHEQMRSIVQGKPPKNPHEADYIAFALTVPSGVRAFAASATGPDWLRWAETQPAFQQLFDPTIDLSESARVLAGWFSEKYALNPDQAHLGMASFARNGPLVNPYLRYELNIRSARVPKADKALALQWSLIVSAAMSTDRRMDELWFQPYGHDDLSPSELLPFVRQAVTPRLTLAEERPWFIQEGSEGSPRVKFGIAWTGDESEMSHLMERIRDDLLPVAASVVQVLEQAITNAYEILAAFDPDHFDSWSFRRSAIEPHAQDEHRDVEDELIDTLRDAAVIEQRRDGAIRPRWLLSPHPLLRRLAVHLLIEDESCDADDKVRELLAGPGVYDHHLKHEVYRLMAAAAPELGSAAKSSLLATALAGPPPFNADEETAARLHERVIFDLLEWISRYAPEWSELTSEIGSVREGRGDIGVRPHPDFDHWMESGTWGGRAPVDTDEFVNLILTEGASFALNALMDHDYSERNFGGVTIEDACVVITAAVRNSAALGAPLADALAPTPYLRQHDLLRAVFSGWEAASLDDTLAGLAISYAELLYPRGDLIGAAARLCRSIVDREVASRPEALLTRADVLVNRIWADHAASFQTGKWSDALTEALNTWPGDFGRYWLHRVSLRWRMTDSRDGLSDDEMSAMKTVFAEFTPASRPALAIVCADLFYLFNADAEFVTANLLPLFDHRDVPERATMMWKAFLHGPRVNDAILDAGFWSALINARSVMGSSEEHQLGAQYWRLIAAVAVHSSAQCVDHRSLIEELATSREQADLVSFLRAADSVISDLDDPQREYAWCWIEQQWQARIQAGSGAQSSSERAAWADLGLSMLELSPLALRLSELAPGPFTHDTRYSDVPESVLRANAEAFALDATRRIQLLVSADWSVQHELSALVAIIQPHTSSAAMRTLAESAVEIGVHHATRWTSK